MPTTPAAARKNNPWPGLIALLLIVIGFSIIPIRNTFDAYKSQNNKDYSRWWQAAQAVRHDEPLFPPGLHQSFIYPPASAVLFYTPLSFAGITAMAIAVILIGYLSYVVAIALSVRYAAGSAGGQNPLVYILPVAVTIPFVFDIFNLGQPNLMLLAAMLGGFLMLDRGKWLASGALFAFATVLKAFPLTVIVYLLWRREFKTAAAMLVLTAIMLVVLPLPVRGVNTHLTETRTWLDAMILGTGGDKLANQPDRAFKFGNQSLMSVVHRLTRPVDTVYTRDRADGFRINLLDLSPTGSFAVFAIIAGALGVWYLWAMPDRRARTGQAGGRARGLEYAILLIMIVMFSPKAGTYYYCWLIPGLAILTQRVIEAPAGSVRKRVLTGALIACIAVMATALAQAFDRFETQALGATMWGAFILLVTLLGILWTDTHRAHGELGATPREVPA